MSLKDNFTGCISNFVGNDRRPTNQKWDQQSINDLLDNIDTKLADEEANHSHRQRIDLVSALLKEAVRPAFSKNKSQKITEQGRKAIDTWQPVLPYDSEEIQKSKPWKYQDPWIFHVFTWCLGSLNTETIESAWPMVIPPIFALLDDEDTSWRIRGCESLSKLLAITPTSLLDRTGLGQVFEETLLPNLLYLPPLTAQEESASLLRSVYLVLLELTHVRFPAQEPSEGKEKLVDRILRQGIFKGLDQANDNIELSRLLLKQMSIFIEEIGIYCVKHLKVVIPMLKDRMTNPFATTSPEYLRDTALTFRSIFANAWPRLSFWRLQIIEALCVPWCRIHLEEQVSDLLKEAQSEIEENIRILKGIFSTTDDHEALDQIERVLASDSSPEPLLQIWKEEDDT